MAKQKGWQKTLSQMTSKNKDLDNKAFKIKKRLDEVSSLLGEKKK